ncbi:hypothetical protein PM082_023226 [Marasmius tenuissimus]|nr:hypothetical protein PM082_023226 [Marasmius tenuissimus]
MAVVIRGNKPLMNRFRRSEVMEDTLLSSYGTTNRQRTAFAVLKLWRIHCWWEGGYSSRHTGQQIANELLSSF